MIVGITKFEIRLKSLHWYEQVWSIISNLNACRITWTLLLIVITTKLYEFKGGTQIFRFQIIHGAQYITPQCTIEEWMLSIYKKKHDEIEAETNNGSWKHYIMCRFIQLHVSCMWCFKSFLVWWEYVHIILHTLAWPCNF